MLVAAAGPLPTERVAQLSSSALATGCRRDNTRIDLAKYYKKVVDTTAARPIAGGPPLRRCVRCCRTRPRAKGSPARPRLRVTVAFRPRARAPQDVRPSISTEFGLSFLSKPALCDNHLVSKKWRRRPIVRRDIRMCGLAPQSPHLGGRRQEPLRRGLKSVWLHLVLFGYSGDGVAAKDRRR